MAGLATDQIDNWVLVTGMMRSGTTFAGRVLSAPLQVDYIHEPFNNGYTLPGKKSFPLRYVPPDASGGEAYHHRLAHLFRYDFGLETTYSPRDPWWRTLAKMCVGSRGPFFLRLAKLNLFHHAAVIKDPIAVRATEYLYSHFDVRPVILVRHPASLAASLKRVGWWPEVKDFRQPELIERYLSDETEMLHREWPSRFLESMAHWRLLHKMILRQARKHPEWIIITHERLSAQPFQTFRYLFDRLDLSWTKHTVRTIERLTGQSNSARARHGQAMDLSRDSAHLFEMRRDSLTSEERRQIFEIVNDVALQLYSRESFALDEAEPR
jgi:hypothetical protein